MSFSALSSWGAALGAALAAHAAFFLVVKPHDEAKIKRSVGPTVSVAGSLSALATKIEATTPRKKIEPAKSRPLAKLDPAEISQPVTQIATIAARALSPVQPVTTHTVIFSQKNKAVKKTKPRQIKAKREPPRKKIKKTVGVNKKSTKKRKVTRLRQDRLEHKKKADKHKKSTTKSAGKTAGKAKSRKRRSKTASLRGGDRRTARRSKVAGRARLANYKGKVRARVAGRARASGRGAIIVSFTVTKGGGVRAIQVSGGSSIHKNAARRAVSGGFPPIPPGLGVNSIRFSVRIRFR